MNQLVTYLYFLTSNDGTHVSYIRSSEAKVEKEARVARSAQARAKEPLKVDQLKPVFR